VGFQQIVEELHIQLIVFYDQHGLCHRITGSVPLCLQSREAGVLHELQLYAMNIYEMRIELKGNGYAR
jgi:hypothetical protein